MAASLDITTVQRVKQAGFLQLDLNDQSTEQLIDGLIDEVSAQFELRICPLLSATLTEEYDLDRFVQRIWLNRWPATSITSIKNRSSIATAWADVTAKDATTYWLGPTFGRVTFGVDLVPGDYALQVIYVAGFAATTAALITSHPEIVSAAERQIAHIYNRRHHPEKSVISDGGMSQTVEPVKLLDSVAATWDKYLRVND